MSERQMCPVPGMGPRCPESICDCFIATHPHDPLALRPEMFEVVLPGKEADQ